MLLGTRLSWREIALLRAYACYMRQINFPYSLTYIAETMADHLHLSAGIVELFLTRFSPVFDGDDAWREQRETAVEERIHAGLERVQNLGQDRIIRQFVRVIKATRRSNFFQPDERGELKPYFSFKLAPGDIPDMPRPVPLYEIYVYSPRLEGVHLRGGKVARGGLRWSDRLEDFRTEVLGLVKAQQVKNAVIVPVGAKGGFVAKRLSADMTRDEVNAEGVECYRTFIRGLLDITDNRDGDGIVGPRHVVAKDDEDPYLVVAADKGTASFSDIANALAEDYDFWLGDAFASGGSVGYDHKKWVLPPAVPGCRWSGTSVSSASTWRRPISRWWALVIWPVMFLVTACCCRGTSVCSRRSITCIFLSIRRLTPRRALPSGNVCFSYRDQAGRITTPI